MRSLPTVVKGTARFAARDIVRRPALPDPERELLLARLAVIEATVVELARQVEQLRARRNLVA